MSTPTGDGIRFRAATEADAQIMAPLRQGQARMVFNGVALEVDADKLDDVAKAFEQRFPADRDAAREQRARMDAIVMKARGGKT